MFRSCFGKKRRNEEYPLNGNPPSYDDITEVSVNERKRIKANEKKARRIEAERNALADQRAMLAYEKEIMNLKAEKRELKAERDQLNEEQQYLSAQEREAHTQYHQQPLFNKQQQSHFYPQQQQNISLGSTSPFAAGGMGLVGGMLLEDAIDNGRFDDGGGMSQNVGGFDVGGGMFGMF